MKDLQKTLASSPVVKAIYDLSRESALDSYLVGGLVRDLMNGAEIGRDYDFIVSGNGREFAGRFADMTGGHCFILDKERDCSRVVSSSFQADFSGMKGGLEEDLRSRDFTINSIAVPVNSIYSEVLKFVDPLDGVEDLRKKILRISSPGSFKDDPLRILRGFRFASLLSLNMDEGVIQGIREYKALIHNVSPERIRTELFQILDLKGASAVLLRMDELGVLEAILSETAKWKGFYQGGWHSYDLFEHSIKTVESLESVLSQLDRFLPRRGREIESMLGEEIEDGVTRRGLLKLAALLHDSGKFYTRKMVDGRGRFFGHEEEGDSINAVIARSLKLGRRSESTIRGLTGNHMRVLSLSKLHCITKRSRYRFFKDTDGFGPELLLLALADAMATPVDRDRFEEMKSIIVGLADYYYDDYLSAPQKPLLAGDEVMSILKISEGKRVGELLSLLREAEAAGKIRDRHEAVLFLRRAAENKV